MKHLQPATAMFTGAAGNRLVADVYGETGQPVRLEDIQNIRAPVLVAVGTKDDITGSPHELAALMPNARAIDIPDRDHMVAVGDKVFKTAALEFLHQRP